MLQRQEILELKLENRVAKSEIEQLKAQIENLKM